MTASGSVSFCFLHACTCSCRSHVMRELIETERIYVEELLSVLLVGQIKHMYSTYCHIHFLLNDSFQLRSNSVFMNHIFPLLCSYQ